MYFPSYNEPPVEVETPTAAPPAREEPPAYRPPAPPPLHLDHPSQRKGARNQSERGAVVVILVLVLVLSAVAMLIGLRWQTLMPPEGVFAPGGSFILPNAAPASQSQIERAPTGDGTVLSLTDRAETGAMSLQDIYKKVIPSIVSVAVYEERGYAEGSGVIMSADGYIITNAHVVEGGETAEVLLEDGRALPALLVGKDSSTDLAVLKIDAQGLTAAEFGNSDDMVVGDMAAAIGNPLGQELRGTMTDGILSAINRDMEVDGKQMTLMQTTAALNSGNSGGALVNEQGQVIGITNMKLVQRGFEAPVEGLGFAIPTTTAKTVVDALIAEGRITGRPVLGITVRPAYPEELAGTDGDYGLLVSQVEERSDAWAKGVRAGDLILRAAGTPLYKNQDLLDIRTALGEGESIPMELFREGKTWTVEVALVEQYIINGD